MNKTHTFEELDKLAEGLRGLDTEKLHDTPEHKKWKAALNTLPKKDRQKYMDEKYQEAKYWQKSQYPQSELIWSYNGERMDTQEVEKLNNTIKGNAVREDVKTVFLLLNRLIKNKKMF